MRAIDVSPVYHDFEPLCEWERGEDLFIVHVPEFKKEHLRVQVNTSGDLKISGERPLEGEKSAMRSRFYKETRVPEGCNVIDIKARLYQGKLTIAMPRLSLNIFPPHSLETSTRTRAPGKAKCGLDEDGEETIGFGRFKVAKETAVNVGIAVVAFAAMGALVIFKPETPPASPPSASFANLGE